MQLSHLCSFDGQRSCVKKEEGNRIMPFSKVANTHSLYLNRILLLDTLLTPSALSDLRSSLLTRTNHVLYAQQAI